MSQGPHHKELPEYDNIYGEEFINQKSVLQIVDLFMTHGGHNSIIESFYFGVPLIVFPVFADQFDSAQRVQDCNYGYRLDVLNSPLEDILSAIEKTVNDKELKNKFKKASQRIQAIRYDLIAADKIESVLNI